VLSFVLASTLMLFWASNLDTYIKDTQEVQLYSHWVLNG
jgi:hypothetical protein